MKISLIAAIVVVIVPALTAAQSGAPPEEVLSLDAAVRLALDGSRPLQNAKLEVAKAEEDLSAARTHSTTTSVEAPASLPRTIGSFVAVDLSADGTEYTSWRRPIRTYFRRASDGWQLVGVERMPEATSTSSKRTAN